MSTGRPTLLNPPWALLPHPPIHPPIHPMVLPSEKLTGTSVLVFAGHLRHYWEGLPLLSGAGEGASLCLPLHGDAPPPLHT